MVERRTRNQVCAGSNPSLLPFLILGNFVLSIDPPVDSAGINEYGMNRSVREGNKCKALLAVQRTGYCAI